MKGLLITYGLTLLGVAGGLYRPYYGFLVYVAFAILRPSYLWFWSVPHGNYSRFVAISVLVGWAMHGFGTWSFGKARWIAVALVVYTLSFVWSSLFAPYPDIAWASVDMQLKVLVPVIVGMSLIENVAQLKQLAWVMVICFGYLALEFNQQQLRILRDGFGGVDNNGVSVLMVTGMGLAFFLGLSDKVWWRRWPAFAAAGLMCHVPMFAMSRGGMLGLVGAGIMTLIVIPKRFFNMFLLVMALGVGLTLAGPSVWEEFNTIFVESEQLDASASSRFDLWRDCMDAFSRYPLTGLGPDHFPIASMRDYGWPIPREAHSRWFSVAAEQGAPGLFSLLGFLLLTMWISWKLMRLRHGDPWLPEVGRMVLVSYAGYIVGNSFVTMDTMEPPYFVAVLAVGAWKVAQLQAAEQKAGAEFLSGDPGSLSELTRANPLEACAR